MTRELKKPVKKVIRLSDKDISEFLISLDTMFKRMSTDEKKAVLLQIGRDKNDIEKLDGDNMLKSIKDEYTKLLPTIDLNDVNTVPTKYKKANEFMTKKDTSTKKELKEKIQKYKEL